MLIRKTRGWETALHESFTFQFDVPIAKLSGRIFALAVPRLVEYARNIGGVTGGVLLTLHYLSKEARTPFDYFLTPLVWVGGVFGGHQIAIVMMSLFVMAFERFLPKYLTTEVEEKWGIFLLIFIPVGIFKVAILVLPMIIFEVLLENISKLFRKK